MGYEKRFKYIIGEGFTDNGFHMYPKDVVDLLNDLDQKWIDELNLRETYQQECARLEAENRETTHVLNDFMDIVNQMQCYFHENNTLKSLGGKDYCDLVILSGKARDLLLMMDIEVKK